jgi:hypothetical protein
MCIINGVMAHSFSTKVNDTLHAPKTVKPMVLVSAAHVVTFAGTLLLLDKAWYRQHPRTSFHLHNDLHHWFQMDKAGHAFSAYQISRLSSRSFQWAGKEKSAAALLGSLAGNVFLYTIEILDGLSAQWGASLSDAGANLSGSLLFYSQEMIWNEQKAVMKYSFSASGLAHYRPDLLGQTWSEQLIKDYNGQTYWLSFNPQSLLGEQPYLPKWLNIAIGYGADGMTGSRINPLFHNDQPIPFAPRFRQFYLSPDVDFSRINSGNKNVDILLYYLNFIKFPAPALEYNPIGGFSFHLIFF